MIWIFLAFGIIRWDPDPLQDPLQDPDPDTISLLNELKIQQQSTFILV